ncbi:malate dehydrogenase (oxaloacetate-decarboxylating) [Anaerospora hongkongensis]|uniref:Malate dehydrogenase (Oxaloacetate-decarboxylating) n=2 Tax=Anaerospora hongkongensis TaxID=244830 RepID=A0A4R1Q416_9FIRM|nr:NADP-dependent malic enzyme [Anaerospora hongkongensis]TCL38772.1 malate dehydrogenase (oxaloacetate-decarboxylating) [Anaerospora hongkongensis]
MDIREAALKLHRDNQGKLAVASKVPLATREDLSLAYTPGVAEPCKEIKADKDLSFALTCRGNMVAIVSDGTRVLGLGDIGPEAAMPVMEGKAVLFKVFGDVDAIPICLDTKDPDKIIETVRLLQPTFAGINLEDLASPKCYDIEDRLKEIMDIPVFHDDQHGTAIAALSAVLGALRYVKKELATAKIVVNGAGAAGSAIGRLLVNAGAENVTMVDIQGALYEGMPGLNRVQEQLARTTNKAKVKGSFAQIAKGADVIIGVSAPGAFTAEIIASMNEPVVIAMANPVPEIMYNEAKAAGAVVAGTGRSDAPNQVNNVTVFPGVFRGAMDVRARQINEEMKIAAAYAIAGLVADDELREDFVVPDAFDPRVAPAVAAAVAKAAIETGVARIQVDPEIIRAKTAARVKLGK